MTKTSVRNKRATTRLKTATLEETIYSVISAAAEPAAVGEIRFRASQLLERDLDTSKVAEVLKLMESKGLLHSRRETKEERYNRAGKKSARGTVATLWWLSSDIPPRVVRSVFKGIALGDGNSISEHDKQSRREYYARNKERLKKMSRRYYNDHSERLSELARLSFNGNTPAKTRTAKTSVVVNHKNDTTLESIIEGLLAEVSKTRIEKLQARIVELEAQLTEIRKIVNT